MTGGKKYFFLIAAIAICHNLANHSPQQARLDVKVLNH